MPKEHKPGWLYVANDNPLGKEYAIHLASGWVYFEDGVRYSPEEIKIMDESGEPPSLDVHNIKKVFKGEIIRYESGKGTIDKGKQNEGSGAKNDINPPDNGGKIPVHSGISPANESGELDIF